MTDKANETLVKDQTEAPASIQLQDLIVAVQAIDLAASKGVYSGGDMETVGRVRNSIAKFVKSNMPKGEQPQEDSKESE